MGYAELLNRLNIDNPKFKASLEKIISATKNSGAITAQLLSFAKDKPPESSIFPAQQFLEELSPIIRTIAGANIILKVDCDPSIALVADKDLLISSLVNMSKNSKIAMENGGAISITCYKAEKREVLARLDPKASAYAHLTIADTGHGVDQQTAERLFEPFFTQGTGGTGLGLAMAYKFITKANGAIWCESEVGVGTKFHMLLPATQHGEKRRAVVQGEGLSLEGQSILLLEDEAAIRASLMENIMAHGARVIAFSTIKEASDYLLANVDTVDFILSDLMLPDGKSVDWLRQVRDISADCKVVVMSGYLEPEILELLKNDNIQAVLSKPFVIEEVLITLGSMIEAGKAD